MKHPHVPDHGYRQGVDGVGSPSDYIAEQDAVTAALQRVIERQERELAELRAEIARLRAAMRLTAKSLAEMERYRPRRRPWSTKWLQLHDAHIRAMLRGDLVEACTLAGRKYNLFLQCQKAYLESLR